MSTQYTTAPAVLSAAREMAHGRKYTSLANALTQQELQSIVDNTDWGEVWFNMTRGVCNLDPRMPLTMRTAALIGCLECVEKPMAFLEHLLQQLQADPNAAVAYVSTLLWYAATSSAASIMMKAEDAKTHHLNEN